MNLPGNAARIAAARSAIDAQPAAAAVHDVDANRGVVGANDLGDLRRDGRDVGRAPVGSVREPMLANRIVHAPRDHVRRAATATSAETRRRRCGLRARGSDRHPRVAPATLIEPPRDAADLDPGVAEPAAARGPPRRATSTCSNSGTARARGSGARSAARRRDSPRATLTCAILIVIDCELGIRELWFRGRVGARLSK